VPQGHWRCDGKVGAEKAEGPPEGGPSQFEHGGLTAEPAPFQARTSAEILVTAAQGRVFE
jgi:hypothetical protein